MKYKQLIIIFLIILSGIIFYIAAESETILKQEVLVTKIIDSDTFEISTGEKIRLIGINGPEKSMQYYEESKQFLQNLISNKTIQIKSKERDKYGRVLAHAFTNNIHINKELIKSGFAHLYYYEKDRYFKELEKAEQQARESNLNIWKKSENSNCIQLINLKFQENKRCNNEEQLILQNNCNEKISITIKDEATHIFKETLEPNQRFLKNFSCIWNNDGDTLFILGNDGLILWWRY